MKITLTTSDNKLFANVQTWNDANIAARSIFKRKNWSDLYYSIIFDDGEDLTGSIDLEPYSFHAPHQKELFTWHLKTFWSNIVNFKGSYPKITQSEKDFFKTRLNTLN